MKDDKKILSIKNFKDFDNNWNIHPDDYIDYSSEYNKNMNNMSKSTTRLEWLNNNGYGIIAEKGGDKSADYRYTGQTGIAYKFTLFKMWADIQIIEYLEDELRISNSSEVFKFFKDKIRDASENKQITSIEFMPMEYNDKDELLFDSNTEIYIDIEDNSDYSDCINWTSLIPAYKRTTDDVICEIGLYLAQSEFIKLIQSTKSSGIEDLLSKKIYNFDSYDIKDTDSLIKYMNLSNIHIKKNEELEKAIDTQKMLYKTHKLLSKITNDDVYDFILPIKLLEEFIKIPII